jgi:hypothetical protein
MHLLIPFLLLALTGPMSFLAAVATLIACDIATGPTAATASALITARVSALAAAPGRVDASTVSTVTAQSATLAASANALVVA